MTRTASGPACVRAGMKGSLSAISSPIANTEKITREIWLVKNASSELEMQPTKVSSPGHYGRSGHGAKAANAANQEGAEEGNHRSTMASTRAMSNSLIELALPGSLGFGGESECILQTEVDHRLGRNR